MFMSIVLWAQVAIFTHVIPDDVDDWDRWFLGRATRTRETLPDFRELCRVARHSQVFCRLRGSQRTPRFWGVTNYIGESLYIPVYGGKLTLVLRIG